MSLTWKIGAMGLTHWKYEYAARKFLHATYGYLDAASSNTSWYSSSNYSFDTDLNPLRSDDTAPERWSQDFEASDMHLSFCKFMGRGLRDVVLTGRFDTIAKRDACERVIRFPGVLILTAIDDGTYKRHLRCYLSDIRWTQEGKLPAGSTYLHNYVAHFICPDPFWHSDTEALMSYTIATANNTVLSSGTEATSQKLLNPGNWWAAPIVKVTNGAAGGTITQITLCDAYGTASPNVATPASYCQLMTWTGDLAAGSSIYLYPYTTTDFSVMIPHEALASETTKSGTLSITNGSGTTGIQRCPGIEPGANATRDFPMAVKLTGNTAADTTVEFRYRYCWV